jgi:hypothetical protein
MTLPRLLHLVAFQCVINLKERLKVKIVSHFQGCSIPINIHTQQPEWDSKYQVNNLRTIFYQNCTYGPEVLALFITWASISIEQYNTYLLNSPMVDACQSWKDRNDVFRP